MRHVAYLTSEYPAVSHTFVQREILAVRAAGTRVSTFSIRRPASNDPRSIVDADELANTTYVLPPKWFALIGTHIATFLSRPLRYLRTLGFAMTVRPQGMKAFVWQLFYFVEAVYLWRAMRKRDIGHVHVHFAMAVATTAMIASELGELTYSVTVHGPTIFYDKARYMLGEKVKRAAHIVCISEFCRSQVMAHTEPVQWKKLAIVHCGVNPDSYVPPDREDRSGPLRLLNVARLSSVKAHDILLEAVTRLADTGTDVACTIVGDGPERKRLEHRARELGIDTRVTFTGAVDQDVIQRYYDEADVFVLPSFAEGVPVVLMEAMAKELPVIACRITGIPELVEDGTSGLLITPGSADQLVDAIATLAENANRRREMGKSGRHKVCTEFDVRESGKQLAGIFAEVGSGTPECRETKPSRDRKGAGASEE